MNDQDSTFLERRLGEELDAIAAHEAPTSLTVSDLIDSGRRRVRRRRTRTTVELTATMVTAAALVAGVVVATGHTGGDTTGPAKHGPKPPATTGTMGTKTDPVAPIVAFGWLPPDRNSEYEVGQTALGYSYNHPVDPTTGLPPLTAAGNSGVQVWGPGSQLLDVFVQGPGAGTDPGVKFTPAGLVQGHQAYWATGTPGTTEAARHGQLLLMWQYEPGAWANVNIANSDTSVATGETMLAVARNVKIGPANPVALPFQLAKLPAGMHPDEADIDLPHQQGSKVGYVGLRLCIDSATCSAPSGGGLLISQGSTTWLSNSELTIGGAPELMRGQPDPAGGVRVTVGGHAATLWTNSSGATLRFTYGTAKVVIKAAGDEYKALGGRAGFLAFCGSLTWLGADPAHWTTHVIG